MRNKLLLFVFLVLTFSAFKSDKPAYKIFNQKGKVVKYKQLSEAAAKADVVFFGELHNNPICHWLQYELTQDLFTKRNGQLILGAEMFEADNQKELNGFLADEYDADSLKKLARLWPNFKTDYLPLVEIAKTNKLPFIATNVPRKYASLVFKEGFEVLDTLSADIKAFIAPLPIAYDSELPGYRAMLEMMEGSSHTSTPENFPKAQAIKDATMAWFISQNYQKGKLFIHYNGSYHSDGFEGILWYLLRLKPEIKILTISAAETAQPIVLPDDRKGVANFIIAVPETMTKTN